MDEKQTQPNQEGVQAQNMNEPIVNEGVQANAPQTVPLSPPYVDPAIEKEFARMKFIERHTAGARRTLWIVGGLLFFVAIFFIGAYVIRNVLPEPDSDGDGVPDSVDACPGHDDRIDKDLDKIPDDCDDAVPPINFDDITFAEPLLLEVGERRYDVVVDVTNANKNWGVDEFRYRVTLKDQEGNVQKTQNGGSYLLPQSTTTLIISGVTTSQSAVSASVEIVSGNFARPATTETIGVDVRDDVFNKTSTSGVAVLKGIVENESNYNLDQVDVRVLVKNKQGNVISANFTSMNTLKVDELRAFELRWDRSFAGEVTYDIVATTNTLNPKNLIRKQGGSVNF